METAMKTKSPKRTSVNANDERPRWVPRDCQSLLTGVSYAEVLPHNRVRLIYTNGYKISAVISKAALDSDQFLDVVDAVEVAFIKPRLHKKLKDMADQLQILEMQKGWHHMLGSQLNQEYEQLREHYELLTGKPFKYQQHA
jgi:hypothetical protein